MITDEQLQQQSEIENDNNWLGTFDTICPVCETMHKPEEIEKLASGVEDDTTWTDYKCLITGETWTHLEHAAIAEAE